MNRKLIILTISAIIIIPLLFIYKKPTEKVVDDMDSAFAYLESWIEENAATLQSNLNPPATLEDINKTEKALGLTFPQKVKDAYLIHNGESKTSDGLFGCIKWLSLDEVIRLHAEYAGFEAKDDLGVFNADVIIPLFQSGGGDLYYVESGPTSELKEWWHEQPTKEIVISKDLEAFFIEFVQKLKNGQYVFIEDDLSALIDKDDL